MQLSRALLLAIGIVFFPKKAVLVYGFTQLIGSVLYSASYYIVFAVKLRKKETAKILLVPNFRSLFITFTPNKSLVCLLKYFLFLDRKSFLMGSCLVILMEVTLSYLKNILSHKTSGFLEKLSIPSALCRFS